KARPGLVSAAVCAVIVAAAALVWHNLPTPTDLYGPFEVRGTAADTNPGRAFSELTSVPAQPSQ
ncbi:hypothetical protein C6A85_13925, partial [Mycobacterium sp. ITM-2017-0098]